MQQPSTSKAASKQPGEASVERYGVGCLAWCGPAWRPKTLCLFSSLPQKIPFCLSSLGVFFVEFLWRLKAAGPLPNAPLEFTGNFCILKRSRPSNATKIQREDSMREREREKKIEKDTKGERREKKGKKFLVVRRRGVS